MNDDKLRYLTRDEIFAQIPGNVCIRWGDISRVTQKDLDELLDLISQYIRPLPKKPCLLEAAAGASNP